MAGDVSAEDEDAHDALRRIEELPPTTFRCAVCGRAVGRFDPAADSRRRRWRRRDRVNVCHEHGRLRDVTFDEWHAIWTRRGKLEKLNIKVPPVQ